METSKNYSSGDEDKNSDDNHNLEVITANLTNSTSTFFSLDQLELKKRAAKELLNCFFMPTETNVKKAMAMLSADPTLAFVKIKNDETITDIRQRGFEGSLLQAAMQTKAVGWLNWLKKAVIEKTNMQEEAQAQYQEKFGQPDERKARMLAQLDIDLEAIKTRLSEDRCRNSNPKEATLDAFETMRNNLAKENEPGVVIKTGEFFPLEIMQKICEVFYNKWNDESWRDNQFNCYLKLMVGFASRYCSADDLLRFLKGLNKQIDEQVPLFGDFKVCIKLSEFIELDLDFTNLEKYPNFCLGNNFFVEITQGDIYSSVIGCGATMASSFTKIENLVSDKNSKLAELTQSQPSLSPSSGLGSRCTIL